jgi:putative sterol carrier protein
MSAFMSGKLRIEGDMANAMQLATLLSKLRS